MRLLYGLIALIICTAFCFKGEPVSILFSPKFGNQNVVPGKNYFLPAVNDSVSVETFRFYVSDICFMKNKKIVFRDKDAHLIDLESQLNILYKNKISDFDEVQFSIGIDSITNSGGVKGGDLDPTKNMYWAWQSGYINFKLEGKSNLCATRKNEFQFHLGGYQFPFNALQTVSLKLKQSDTAQVTFDVRQFIWDIDLTHQNQIMSPSKEAVLLSKKVAKAFSIKQ